MTATSWLNCLVSRIDEASVCYLRTVSLSPSPSLTCVPSATLAALMVLLCARRAMPRTVLIPFSFGLSTLVSLSWIQWVIVWGRDVAIIGMVTLVCANCESPPPSLTSLNKCLILNLFRLPLIKNWVRNEAPVPHINFNFYYLFIDLSDSKSPAIVYVDTIETHCSKIFG